MRSKKRIQQHTIKGMVAGIREALRVSRGPTSEQIDRAVSGVQWKLEQINVQVLSEKLSHMGRVMREAKELRVDEKVLWHQLENEIKKRRVDQDTRSVVNRVKREALHISVRNALTVSGISNLETRKNIMRIARNYVTAFHQKQGFWTNKNEPILGVQELNEILAQLSPVIRNPVKEFLFKKIFMRQYFLAARIIQERIYDEVNQ
jgi:hypothetical protein